MIRHPLKDQLERNLGSEYDPACGLTGIIDNHPLTGVMSKFLTSDQEKLIQMCREGFIVNYDYMYYVCVNYLGMWYPLMSELGSKCVADYLDVVVPVNYEKAIMCYLPLLQYAAPMVSIEVKSVCISSWRLAVTCDDNEVTYKVVTDVVKMHCDFSHRLNALVMRPLFCNYIPSRVRLDHPCKVTEFLSHVYNEHELELIEWTVGHGLLDPAVGSHILFITGRLGGEGKSRTINLLSKVLHGTISPLSRDYMSEGSPNAIDKAALVHHRFVTYGECKVNQKSQINEGFVKNYFGGDIIRLEGSAAKVTAVGLFASNKLWFSTQMQPWRLRRIYTIMLGSEYKGPRDNLEPSNLDRIRYISRCIRTRLKYDRPPFRARDFIINMFGTGCTSASRGVVFDDKASDFDCMIATTSLSLVGLVPVDELIRCAKSMSPELVVERHGEAWIKGIRCTNRY